MRLPQELDEQAMLYALGILDSEDRQALRAKLQGASDLLHQEVMAYQATVDVLASVVAPVLPPPTLRDRFIQRMALEATREARAFEHTANTVALGSAHLAPPSSLRERLLSQIEEQVDVRVTVESSAPALVKGDTSVGDGWVGREKIALTPGATDALSRQREETRGMTLGAWLRSCWRSMVNVVKTAGIRVMTSKVVQQSAKGLTFVHASEGVWLSLAPGVSAKVLSLDRISGRVTSLVRFSPGTSYAPHRHAAAEELYVLEGGCLCAGHELKVGDYHRAEAGTEHHDTSSDDGCLLLVISSPQNEML